MLMTATVRGISVDGRGGSIDLNAREYSIVYKVGTDDRADGPSTVRIAFGIPSIGDVYAPGNDIDNAAVVISKEVEQGDSPWEWLVTVKYSTDIGDKQLQNLEQQIDNPLLIPPEVTFGFQERRILIPGSFNNPIGPPSSGGWEAGIFAPNGELFDPQPEADYADPVLSVKKNVQTIDYATLMKLANCVNSDLFQGAEPRQLRIKPPTANRKFHKSIGYYWELAYSLVYRWETWDVQVLNQGTFYWTGGKPTNVWGTTTLPKVKAIPNGQLRMVNLTTSGDVNTSSTPTFTRIRYYREVPFGSLGIL